MIIFLSITTCIFLTLSVIFLSLYSRNKYLKEEKEYNFTKLENENEILKNSFNILKDEILSDKRVGYYSGKKTLVSEEARDKPGTIYNTCIYVTEIDRYTNGQSKIKLDKVEILSGFDHGQYNWVKTLTKEQFCSIKNTADITWLESEVSIVKQRKDKITEILERMKAKNKEE